MNHNIMLVLQCACPENIHIPPTEGIGISWGVGNGNGNGNGNGKL